MNHFEQTRDTLIKRLSVNMTGYSSNAMNMLVSQYMRYHAYIRGQVYNTTFNFTPSDIDKIHYRILSDYHDTK